MQDYNFAIGSVWLWNLVSDIKRGTYTEGVWEQGAENILTEEGWSDGRVEKMHNEELRDSYSSPSIIRTMYEMAKEKETTRKTKMQVGG
jgi:hypothetical protein